MACDRRGWAVAFRLLPGHRGESRAAPAPLAASVWLGPVGRVTYDRAYSAAWWREMTAEAGAEPIVPANPTRPAVRYGRPAYRRRNRVERLWGRLKEWRAMATRYEKTAEGYLGVLHVAASLGRIRQSLT